MFQRNEKLYIKYFYYINKNEICIDKKAVNVKYIYLFFIE